MTRALRLVKTERVPASELEPGDWLMTPDGQRFPVQHVLVGDEGVMILETGGYRSDRVSGEPCCRIRCVETTHFMRIRECK